MQYISKAILKQIYKKRKKWVHKGQFGKLLVISGCYRHTGSPIFVGMSANRAGCDLVYIASPERSATIAANYSPCLITEPLKGDMLTSKNIPHIMNFLKITRATAVVIGPGLWRENQTRKAIIKLIEKIDLPMVIDADAIRAISKKKYILKRKKCVLTPHADEFRELTGIKLSTNLNDRIKKVKKQAKINSVIILKGHIDIISDGLRINLNKTGSTLMTKGGCGDTLSGICGAYLARGVDLFTSACAASYVNGKAGELAAKQLGESFLPTDLIDNICKVI
ncbi:MAG: NAD(P)H-hydrate dehydratase [Candidatus Aenigmatarchaeota archaeon]